MECVKPRRKNSPLDYFCLHFGWLQTNSKLGNLLFDSTSSNAFWHSFAVPLCGGFKWNASSRVGKIVHWTIFAFISVGSRPTRNLATSFSIPHLLMHFGTALLCLFVVASSGIEPLTRGFSVLCSTN